MANFSLGEAVLGTGVDLKGLKKGLGAGERESRSAWQRIGGIAEKALGFLTGTMMVRGFDALTGMARDLGDTLLNEAPRVEQLRTSFENLAESAGQSSDDILQAMRDAANGMVTDADLMESYNNAMLLVGESMADKFPDLLQIAQASAAATGEDVNFMLDSLVTGIGRGSPMILDNLGLTINLSEAYDEYAATLGIAADEMSKAQQQEALLNAVIESGAGFIERLGDNTGGTAQTLAQLRVSMENAKMGIATALLPALEAILTPLSELATQYGPQVVAFAEDAGQWLGVFLPGAIRTLQGVFEFFRSDGPAALDKFQQVFAIVGPAVQGIAGQLTGWFAANLPLMQAVLDRVRTSFEIWQPALDNVWNAIVAIVRGAIGILLNIITVGMALFTGNWSAAWEGVQQIGVVIWETIKTVAREFLQGLANTFGTTLGDLTALWERNFEMAREIVSRILGNIKKFIAGFDLKSAGEDLLRGFIDGVRGMAGAVKDAVSGVLGDALQAGKDFLGISSPSKVFEELAHWTWEGFTLGTDAMAQDVEASVQGTMAVAPTAAMAAAGAGGPGGGVNINLYLDNVTLNNDRDVDEWVRIIAERLGEEVRQLRF